MQERGSGSWKLARMLPLLLLVALLQPSAKLLRLAEANPGLLKTIGHNPEKFMMVLDGLAKDSAFVEGRDMGVKAFNFSCSVENPVYPHSPQHISVVVYVYMKYSVWQGVATIKAFMSAETKDLAKTPSDLFVSPTFVLTSQRGAAHVYRHVFSSKAAVQSYWDPPSQCAMVYGFESRFELGDRWEEVPHEWELTTDIDPKPWSWNPAKDLNLLDGRGVVVPPPPDLPASKRDVYVVMRPLFNVSAYIMGPLIIRHVEYYQSLGVAKHIIYCRRDSIPALFLANPRIAKLVELGMLVIVLWDQFPQHDLWKRRYDQRIVYSHAVLAFTGLDALIMNIEIDEYLVTPLPELQGQPIQKLLDTCSKDTAEVKITRYHTLCQECDHTRPESYLWGPSAHQQWPHQHPLSWYKLTNHQAAIMSRSVFNPNCMRSFYVHHGSLKSGHSPSHVDPDCMFFVHLVHLFKVSLPPESLSDFEVDYTWTGMLDHVEMYQFPPVPEPPPPKPAAAPAQQPAAAA